MWACDHDSSRHQRAGAKIHFFLVLMARHARLKELRDKLRDCKVGDLVFQQGIVWESEGSVTVECEHDGNLLLAFVAPQQGTSNGDDRKRNTEAPSAKVRRGNQSQSLMDPPPSNVPHNSLEEQHRILDMISYHDNIVYPLSLMTGSFPKEIENCKYSDCSAEDLFTFLVVERDHQPLSKYFMQTPAANASLCIVWRFCLSLSRALLRLEEKKIVHLNLSLDTVLKDRYFSEAVVSGFGYAKQVGDDFSLFVDEHESIGGDKNHLAPEIVWRESPGEINLSKQMSFALGVLMHEIIYGDLPFVDDMHKLDKGSIPTRKIIKREAPVSREVLRVMSALLRIDPKQRISLQEAFTELNNVYESLSDLNDRYERSLEAEDPEILFQLGKQFEESVPSDVRRSIKLYFLAKVKEHPEAMCRLGEMHQKGVHMEKNVDAAMRLYHRAADLGCSEALFKLGNLYELGQSVKKNELKSLEYYHKAAELGNLLALYNLGCIYQEGTCVLKDEERGFQYFLQAASQGHADAQHNVAYCYQQGEGTEHDIDKAIHYYTKSLETREDGSAAYNLGDIYYHGRCGIPQNHEVARAYFERAAKLQHTISHYVLGKIYKYGQGVPIDYDRAQQYFHFAAERGDSDAMVEIGNNYKNGWGVPIDFHQQAQYFQRASDTGNAVAMYNLSLCYHRGEGVAASNELEIEYLNRAAALGVKSAVYNLAICYDSGEGVAMDKQRACELYEQAAHLDHTDAQYNVAVSYEIGEGVPINLKKALDFFQLAAYGGDNASQQKVDQYKRIR